MAAIVSIGCGRAIYDIIRKDNYDAEREQQDVEL